MSVRTYVNDWPIRDGLATCQPLGLLSPESSLCRWSWSEWIGKLTINLPQPCSHLRLLSFSMIVPALFHCRKAKSPDSAINTAMYVNGLAGTEQDYQQRCDDLKVLLQSMEESGNRPGSRTSNRPVLVDSLSPRSQKAEAERMQGLQRALDEAAHLRSETERLSQKVFNRIGQPQS
eukprot:scpid77141/ scgid5548/ 